ncbi:molybdopterin-guanine dinucleotide biosynthesis protein B [Staphylococcus schleiferi]|uniref:molybdopterin-guanine dinucleotide biosynthesis protein B n=1 Tax=Staphylococcus schleiferi TaxID=1295 RepID=UPI002480E92D|nr:molybdopterin-guanine dinucleotide biosynthesis protein B [Staphylococcus schleiferi]
MILQVVGYKGVGKTTVVSRIVEHFKRLGYPVVTIKHHGHAHEEITLPHEHVDHMRHFNAGADQSIVQGHQYIESIQRYDEMSLQTLIRECVTIDDSIILVEGYKNADYDKVILYRNQAEFKQLNRLKNVKYALHRDKVVDEFDQFERWLDTWVQNNKG